MTDNEKEASQPHGGRRLSRFEVRGLFGWLHHTIDLRTDERITILHGPNGVGKTTVLKLIVALFSRDYRYLRNCRFEELVATTIDGSELHVGHHLDEETEHPGIRLELRTPDALPVVHVVERRLHRRPPSRYASMLDDMVPWLERIGPHTFFDRRAREKIEIGEAIERYGEDLPFDFPGRETSTPEPILQFLRAIDVHLIETQRLLSIREEPRHYEGRAKFRQVVEEHAEGLSRRIQEVLRLFATQTASLDRTFPQRLLREPVPESASEDAIRKKYEAQRKYRTRLMNAGLLDTAEQVDLPEQELEQSDFRVLWHYLNDTEAKFEVFQDLLARVELFLTIINGKKFLRKTLKIDKDSGYRFVWEDSVEGEAKIPLNALSSGEQHELVLAYHLLFEAKPDALILVDEPELSLHVTWQHDFLDDLERISSLATLDFLIATHSPAIVGRRRSLMVELASE